VNGQTGRVRNGPAFQFLQIVLSAIKRMILEASNSWDISKVFIANEARNMGWIHEV